MISDAVAIQLGAATLTLIGTIATGILAYYTKKLDSKAKSIEEKTDVAATQREQVKTEVVKTGIETAAKLEEIAVTSVKTHELVNGKMTAALRQIAELSRMVANATGKPEDIQSAHEAERLLAEHLTRQPKGE